MRRGPTPARCTRSAGLSSAMQVAQTRSATPTVRTCARASRAESHQVYRPFLHLHLLAYFGVVFELHRVSTLWYDEDHPILFLPELHQLNGAVCFPIRDTGGSVYHALV
ncbi:hypothetical protein ACFX15_018540 [Malus domestica]